MTRYAVYLAALATLLIGCDRQDQQASAKSRGAADSLILATTRYAGAAPAFVALSKGYFENEGLSVTVQAHLSGKSALDAVIANQADVATVAELPVAIAASKGQPVTILATLSTQTGYAVVGRTDRGVSTPASLKGKRIAVASGTTADFFLDALLVRQRLSRADIEVFDGTPSEMIDTLENGRADAVSTWEPYISEARQRLGASAIAVFSSEGIYESTFNLASTRQFAKERRETVKKVLRAIDRAEQFIADDPAATERIVAEALKVSPEEARDLLSKNRFALSLDQNLLVIMEDESRWAIKTKIIDAGGAVNLLDAVYVDGLAAIKPRAVTVIR